MGRINKEDIIYQAVITAIVLIIAFLSRNYVIAGLFFACSLIGLYIMKPESFYERLYSTLMISAIFENTFYVPGHEKIYIVHIVLVIFTIATVLKVLRDRTILKKFNKKVVLFYGIWFLYMLLGSIWAKSKSLNIKFISIYIMMFVLLFNILVFNNSLERFKKSIKIMGMMFLVTLIIGFTEGMIGHQLPVKHSYGNLLGLTPLQIKILTSRATAFFFNSNNFGTYITICIPFVLTYFYYTERFSKRLLYCLWALLSFIVLIFTSSRTNIYAAAFSLLILIILVLKERGLKVILYPLVLVVLFGISYKYAYILNNSTYYKSKMNTLEKAYTDDTTKIGGTGSIDERITIYYDVLNKIIMQKKFLGLGAGNTQQYLTDKGNTNGIVSPHGLAIELLGDFGIPIVVLYGIFYIYLLYSLNRVGRNKSLRIFSNALLISLLTFAIGSFSPSSVTYYFPNWILFGYSISLIQIGRDNSQV